MIQSNSTLQSFRTNTILSKSYLVGTRSTIFRMYRNISQSQLLPSSIVYHRSIDVIINNQNKKCQVSIPKIPHKKHQTQQLLSTSLQTIQYYIVPKRNSALLPYINLFIFKKRNPCQVRSHVCRSLVSISPFSPL